MGWNVLLYGAAAVAAVFGAWLLLQGIWRGLGRYRIWLAGPRRLLAFHHTIWRQPSALPDAEHGPGSEARAPVAPFRFIEEESQFTRALLARIEALRQAVDSVHAPAETRKAS
jgi:hypothetical protein